MCEDEDEGSALSETRSLNPPFGIYTSTSVLISRDKRYNVLVKQGRNSYG